MKRRGYRRAAGRISNLRAELDAVKTRELTLRKDLEIATATFERVKARENARLEASPRAQIVEAENGASRALEISIKARSAVEAAETTAKASRPELYSLQVNNASRSILEAADLTPKEYRLASTNAQDAQDLTAKQFSEANATFYALPVRLRQLGQDSESK